MVIRCRPLSGQEKIDNREKIVDMDSRTKVATLQRVSCALRMLHSRVSVGHCKAVKDGAVSVRRPGTQDSKNFTFDAVYDEHTIQNDFYEHTGYAIAQR